MKRIDKLETAVTKLYTEKRPERDDWADWLWEYHVITVANFASELAERFGVDPDLSRAAALLHDIADVMTQRSNPEHEQMSLDLGRKILKECGYDEEEVSTVIDDAGKFHSCHGSDRPKTDVGKVLATADALGHLKTDFYALACERMLAAGRQKETVQQWVREKIEREYHDKILFAPVQKEVEPLYTKFKEQFA